MTTLEGPMLGLNAILERARRGHARGYSVESSGVVRYTDDVPGQPVCGPGDMVQALALAVSDGHTAAFAHHDRHPR